MVHFHKLQLARHQIKVAQLVFIFSVLFHSSNIYGVNFSPVKQDQLMCTIQGKNGPCKVNAFIGTESDSDFRANTCSKLTQEKVTYNGSCKDGFLDGIAVLNRPKNLSLKRDSAISVIVKSNLGIVEFPFAESFSGMIAASSRKYSATCVDSSIKNFKGNDILCSQLKEKFGENILNLDVWESAAAGEIIDVKKMLNEIPNRDFGNNVISEVKVEKNKNTQTSILKKITKQYKQDEATQVGNLYVLQIDYPAYINKPKYHSDIVLISALSGNEALSRYKEIGNMTVQIGANVYTTKTAKIVGSCEGTGWGAVVAFRNEEGTRNSHGWACGAASPDQALRVAWEKCEEKGEKCAGYWFNLSIYMGRGGKLVESSGPFGETQIPPGNYYQTDSWAWVFQEILRNDASTKIHNADDVIRQFYELSGDVPHRPFLLTKKNQNCVFTADEKDIEAQRRCIDKSWGK